MLALAAYFANKSWPSLEQPRASADVTKRALTAIGSVGCTGCHLGEFQGDGSVPRLAGQSREYLAKTIAEFRTRERANNPGMSDLMSATSAGRPRRGRGLSRGTLKLDGHQRRRRGWPAQRRPGRRRDGPSRGRKRARPARQEPVSRLEISACKRESSASSVAMRCACSVSVTATSGASKRCGMCCGQFASQAATVKRSACSGSGTVIFRHQPLQELGVILDDARLAPELDPLAVHIVDQEKMRLRILGEIAERDILPVAPKIGEADRLLIKHLEEARRPAAMLDVRLAVLARRGEEDARLRFDERRKIRRDPRLPGALLLHRRIGLPRSLARLRRLYRCGEGDIARVALRVHAFHHKPRSLKEG